MTDKIKTAHRSWNMSQIRSINTKPELCIRTTLFKMGYRFRLHRDDLPGKPDIVLPKYKTVIFVHGCFWHGHQNCKKASIPKSNTQFWLNKIRNNIIRFNIQKGILIEQGWRVFVIWECTIMKEQHTLPNFLNSILESKKDNK
ncbi:MAG: DNA mismatch endonuclease Vsr [Ignavibacteriales bacterium]|nr:DNA mismatch endonuclease Vsr [Ignavibacteriales bacterium]